MKILPLLALLALQQAPFVEQIEVRIHDIDVIVTDKTGNAVEGLRKEDFELLELRRRHAAVVRRRVENRLTTLRAIIATMATLPGRKVLVTFTESLPATPGLEFFDDNTPGMPAQFDISDAPFETPSEHVPPAYLDLRPVLDELARMASSNGITLYGIQPEFDLRLSFGDDDKSLNTIAVQRALENTADTMNILTGKTGGKFLRGDTHADEVLRTIERDVASYYSLAYRAGDDYDKAHKVAVRVRNHPE